MPKSIKSNVIEVGHSSMSHVTLEDYIKNKRNIPVNIFTDDNSVTLSAIESAINFLTSRGEGIVEIPSSEDHNTVLIRVSLNKNKESIINFTTSHYKKPTSGRPYTGDRWLVGDIIINTDISTNPCMGWVCTESGTPGTWSQFANIKSWHTQIEELNYLPDPSYLQNGRQVLYHNEETGIRGLYYCTEINGTYVWIQQNMAMGSEDQRPTNPSDNWWYFNTSIGYPQWYDAKFKIWRTIYDKDAYESMWADQLAHAKSELQKKLDEGYETVIVSTKAQLEELYDSRYNAWLELITSNYAQMIKEPVDDYLNVHPLLISQRYNIANVTASKSSLDASGNRVYQCYELENGDIDNLSVLPDVFMLNLGIDEDCTNESYLKLFNKSYKIVDVSGLPVKSLKAGVTVTLLVRKSSDICTLNSSASNTDSELIDVGTESGAIISSTATSRDDYGIRLNEVRGKTKKFRKSKARINGHTLKGSAKDKLDIKEIHGHTEYDAYHVGVREGSSILTASNLAKRVGNFELDGYSKQKQYSGVNLVDFGKPYTHSNGTTSEFKDDTLIVNGDGSEGYQSVQYQVTDIIKANPGKTISFGFDTCGISNESVEKASVQFNITYNDDKNGYPIIYIYKGAHVSYTIPNDVSNIKLVLLSIYPDNVSIDKVLANTVTITKPMLYFGTVDEKPDYEPYCGGVPSPNPNHPQKIENVGRVRNLFDYTTFQSKVSGGGVTITNNFDGSFTATGTKATQGGINLEGVSITLPAGTYIISGSIGYQLYTVLLLDDGKLINSNNKFTLDRETVIKRIIVQCGDEYTNTPTTIYPMLRTADILDDTYHPYIPENKENLIDISQITVAGTTTIDKDIENETVSVSGTAVWAQTQVLKIQVTPNEYYVLSAEDISGGNSPRLVIQRDSDFTTIASLTHSGEIIFKVPEGETNIRVVFVANNTDTTLDSPVTAKFVKPRFRLSRIQAKGSKYVVDTKIIGKNLARNNLKSQSRSGIDLVVNSDGSLTFNGTADDSVDFYLSGSWQNTNNIMNVDSGNFISKGTKTSNIIQYIVKNQTTISGKDDGADVKFTVDKGGINAIIYRIKAGVTLSNYTVYPQVESGTVSTDYEPYKENTLSVHLDKPLYGIDDCRDRICNKNGVWGVERRINVLNVSKSNVTDWGTGGGGHDFFVRLESHDASYGSSVLKAMCNKFISSSLVSLAINEVTYRTTGNSGWGYYGRLHFRVPPEIDTVEKFKEYVGNDCIAIHEFIHPIFVPFEDQSQFDGLAMYSPYTCITNDADTNMRLEFYKSTQDTYEDTDIVAPTPRYPVELKHTGLIRNLADCSGLVEKVESGVTFTPIYDENGLLEYIEANGTANNHIVLKIGTCKCKKNESYTFNGCPSNGGTETYRLDLRRIGMDGMYSNSYDAGNGMSFDTTEDVEISVCARIHSGYTANKLRFYPMIRPTHIVDPTYHPYIPENKENLLKQPYVHGNSRTDNGITFTVEEDGTITANGTATGSSATFMVEAYSTANGKEIIEKSKGKKLIIDGCPSGGSTSTYRLQVWCGDKGAFQGFDNGTVFDGDVLANSNWNVAIVILNGVTVNNLKFKPRLRFNHIPKQGSQYVVDAKTTGKNLINQVCVPNGLAAKKHWLKAGAYVASRDSSEVKGNTWYIRATDKNGNIITNRAVKVTSNYYLNGSSEWFYGGTSTTQMVFELKEDCYVSIASLNGSGNTYFQLEYGTEATSYEPYQSHSITIHLDEPLLGIGEYRDTICQKDGVWGVERVIRRLIPKNIIDGWYTNDRVTRICSVATDAVKTNNSDSILALSNMLMSCNANRQYHKIVDSLYTVSKVSDGRISITIESDDLTNESIKQFLKDNDVEIYYPLATPTFTPFEDQNLPIFDLLTHNGITYLRVDEDTKSTINGYYFRLEGSDEIDEDNIIQSTSEEYDLVPIISDLDGLSAYTSPKAFKLKLINGVAESRISLVGGVTHYFNYSASEALFADLYDINGNSLGQVGVGSSVFIPSNCAYVDIYSSDKSTIRNTELIISTDVGYLDSEISDKLPSLMHFEANLDLYGVGTYYDRLYYEAGSYYVEHTTKCLLLTGDEVRWTKHDTIDNTYYLPLSAIDAMPSTEILMSNAQWVTSLTNLSSTDDSCFVDSDNLYVRYTGVESIIDLDSFLAYLRAKASTDHPVKIVYASTTSTIEKLTEENEAKIEELFSYTGFTKIATSSNGVVPTISVGHLSTYSANLANINKQLLNVPRGVSSTKVKSTVTDHDGKRIVTYKVLDTSSIFNSNIPDIMLFSFIADEPFGEVNYLELGSRSYRILTSTGYDPIDDIASGIVVTVAINMASNNCTLLSSSGNESDTERYGRLSIVASPDRGSDIISDQVFEVYSINDLDNKIAELTTNTAGIAVSMIPYVADGYYIKCSPKSGYTVEDVIFSYPSKINLDATIEITYNRNPLVGFVIDQNDSEPTNAVSYRYDATQYIENDVSTMDLYPFNLLKPCLVNSDNCDDIIYLDKTDISKTVDGATADLTSGQYNQFLEIPTIYYRFAKYQDKECQIPDSNGRYLEVLVTPYETEGFARYPEDTTYDFGMIGLKMATVGTKTAEDGSTYEVLRSVSSGTVPQSNNNIAQFRELALANNKADKLSQFTYSLNTYENVVITQILAILYGKSLDTQSKLGRGICGFEWNGGIYPSTDVLGDSDTTNVGNNFHHSCSSNDNKTHMKFLWMEDIYGYFWEFVDGLVPKLSNKLIANICNIVSKMNSNGDNYLDAGTLPSVDGYTKKVLGTNKGTFLPSELGASTATYYSDYSTMHNDYSIRSAIIGGCWSSSANVGLFYWRLSSNSNTSALDNSARLAAYRFRRSNE